MIERDKHDIVADERAIANGDAALILKFAACVDEDVFPDGDVFSAVGIKRRETRKGLIDGLSKEFRKQSAKFFGRVVGAVDLHRDAQRLLA